MKFEVWAPSAQRVDVEVLGRHRAMRRSPRGPGGGWWELDVEGVPPGTEYAYRLDEGEALPDPRSPWQPSGVDGPSRTVDHGAVVWGDADWSGVDLTRSVLYELHVGTFSDAGTFAGVVEHLDHLVDLGVDVLELLPVAQFPGDRNWGYDGVGLWAPHDGYGGPEGLKQLVDACHARRLGVFLDVVYNHVGPEGNHLRRFGPYFTDVYRTPWGEAVNYDQRGSHEVRRFVVDNALMWLRHYHLDGLRLDAVHAIVDTSAVHLLEELAGEVARLSEQVARPLWLVAESDLNDPRVVSGTGVGGYGIHAQWSDDFHHALHSVVTGERAGYYADVGSMADLASAFEDTWLRAGEYSPHRGRIHGRPHGGLPPWKFLAYAQNHDQVGNRAGGDRLSQTLAPDRLKVVAALTLLSPYTPMLFQGEEWGASTPFQYFTSHRDPALGHAVAEGRRAEFAGFGWSTRDVPDPQDPATFERSRLRWGERHEGVRADLLAWHRELLAWRRVHGGGGPVTAEADEEGRTIAVRRADGILLAANLGERPAALPVGPGDLLLRSHPGVELDGPRLVLAPDSVGVVGPSVRS